jgi:hypothetical protein
VDLEKLLIQQHGISTDPADLHRQINEILVWEKQYKDLTSEVEKLKAASSKFNEGEFVDTIGLVERWGRVGEQLAQRKKGLAEKVPEMSHLKSYIASENWWLYTTYDALKKCVEVPVEMEKQKELLDSYQVIGRQSDFVLTS